MTSGNKRLRPMLAAPAPDIQTLRYPLFASKKLDGVRALIVEGKVLSRTLKPIPNRLVQECFGTPGLGRLDGELILGSPTDKDCYRKTVSCVMTEYQDITDLRFYVFDYIGQGWYYERTAKIQALPWRSDVEVLQQETIYGPAQLEAALQDTLEQGYEGLILRHPDSPYKYGRSTQHEQYMLKLKPFEDAEAIVVGFQELYSNYNKPTLDERGYTKRSSHQEGQVPQDTLGALLVKFNGMDFAIGTGFTAVERQEIWDSQKLHMRQSKYLGKLVKFKYMKLGMKDAPRHPVFLGWRHKEDI